LIFELGSPCVFPCFSARSRRAISFWLRVLFTMRAQAEIVRAEILVNLFILLVSLPMSDLLAKATFLLSIRF
jgi:hypothetical protein